MRAVVVMVLMLLSACPEPVDPPAIDAPEPDGPPKMDAAICPGERIWGPFDMSEPLYGEACTGDGVGCRPDPSVPGDWAGVCVGGVCRPRCGFYEFPPGVNVGQCCSRGGNRQEGPGYCACVP